MPPSQLKQLKASLRDSGVIRPAQSKKKRRQDDKNSAKAQQTRLQRQAALERIREQFNPFEIKPARGNKFDVTTRDGSATAGGQARPGVTKSLGEERRRATLLKELHSRNKVGSINDRRFGENDPTMTPEERAAARFARESQRKLRKESLFNLEEDGEEDEMQLTHLGESLSFSPGDDFAEDVDAGQSSDEEESGRKRKRVAALDEVDDMEGLASADEDNEEEPLRKKTKAEVMKEVIAKSKLYKYERQKTKEEDDELRAELDKGLPDLFELMRGIKPAPKPEAETQPAASKEFGHMDPARAALLQGKNETDAEYDKRMKQLAFDKRSQPTDRTKTEEERAQEEAERLKALEADRLRRMRGEESESEEETDKEGQQEDEENDDFVPDDAKAFGLGHEEAQRPELGVEDEDDFVIDEDLVEMDSNASLSFIQSDEEDEDEDEEEEEEEESDDEMMKGFSEAEPKVVAAETRLAYTYPCPGSHEEFLDVLKDVPVTDIPVVIQRIRALYHPRLHADNKAKLGRFSQVLVEHVVYMANHTEKSSFTIIENIIRHVHSMAKSNSEPVAQAFRAHMRKMTPPDLHAGDLAILTGVMAVFPTSDHFHAVVTPANLCIARYLGLSSVKGLSDLATGAYLSTLSLQYQSLAKRYMPEFVNYSVSALSMLSPVALTRGLSPAFVRLADKSLRFASATQASPKLRFWDVIGTEIPPAAAEPVKAGLIDVFVTLLDAAAALWSSKSAFTEIFQPVVTMLKHLKKHAKQLPTSISRKVSSSLANITSRLDESRLSRRPLLLHNHRPLAIKTSIPKFEEDFNPDRHYDPNRERAELSRLRAEHKRERKGAMRELRKDANFVAREALREKKIRDAEYEKKYRRLVAEIQGEEGREAKAYEREKNWRRGKK